MSRRIRILFTAVGIVLTLGISLRLAAPRIFRFGLAAGLGRVCRECVFKFGETQIDFLGGELQVAHVLIQGDPSDSPRFKILADQVDIHLSWLALFGLMIEIKDLSVHGILVQLIEREDTGPPSPPRYPWLYQLPRMHVQALHVRGGHFVYGREGKTGNGLLTFDGITLDTGEFGTKREVSPPRFKFVAAGHTLGNPQGKIEIEADVGLFEQTKIDSAKITVSDESMAALNTFLPPVERIRIGGKIRGAQGQLEIRDQDLDLRLKMAYTGFSLSIEPKPGARSGLESTVAEWIGKFITASRRPQKDGDPWPETWVRAHQKPNESVFLFILNGLKDGALAILRGKTSVI